MNHSLWEYAQADHIAEEYDDYFAYNRLFDFDQQTLLEAFRAPGTLVDLGCGTGRLLLPFAARGFTTVGVDLSAQMLRVVRRKALRAQVPVDVVQANMVELECFADASADYVICMFSSLGMVRGREHRAQTLAHVRRILKPGGRFAIHVHNRWRYLFEPVVRWWLLANWLRSIFVRDVEAGDRTFEYRRIPQMTLHTFSRREILHDLRAAGFRVERLLPLDTDRQRELPRSWWFPSLRANGWILFCRTAGAETE